MLELDDSNNSSNEGFKSVKVRNRSLALTAASLWQPLNLHFTIQQTIMKQQTIIFHYRRV